jgi:hypothetical protein
MWHTTKEACHEEYYRPLNIVSTKNVALGKHVVPGVLYNNLVDKTKAFIIDAHYLKCNEEYVMQLVHSVDREGHVDYQSTLRVRQLNFRNHPKFECGVKGLTHNRKEGNIKEGEH